MSALTFTYKPCSDYIYSPLPASSCLSLQIIGLQDFMMQINTKLDRLSLNGSTTRTQSPILYRPTLNYYRDSLNEVTVRTNNVNSHNRKSTRDHSSRVFRSLLRTLFVVCTAFNWYVAGSLRSHQQKLGQQRSYIVLSSVQDNLHVSCKQIKAQLCPGKGFMLPFHRENLVSTVPPELDQVHFHL